MIKVMIIGRTGRMGRLVESYCNKASYQVVGGVSKHENAFEQNIDFDIIVDFSLPLVFRANYQNILNSGKAYICGITGLSDEDMLELKTLSNSIPVLYSSNFSYGLQLLIEAIHSISHKLPEKNTIEIVEKHHINKKDIPSGTAITLAEGICKNSNYSNYSNDDTKRDSKTINIHSLRGGQIVGDHSVQIILENEMIELKHSAFNRDIFAQGAVAMIEKMLNRKAAFYSFSELIKE